MEKTYYDILEVSRYATDEVINRAHKVLVKRYHPDLQKDEAEKKKAAEEMVKVNEAYAVLSDKDKKAEYDRKIDLEMEKLLSKSKQTASRPTNTGAQANQTNQGVGKNQNPVANRDIQYTVAEEEYLRERQKYIDLKAKEAELEINRRQAEMMQDLNTQYYRNLRRMGYKVKEPFSLKRFMMQVLVVAILLLIVFLIFKIPVTNRWMYNVEAANPILGVFIRLARSLVGGN